MPSNRGIFFLLTAVVAATLSSQLVAQKFLPKSIQFKGASGYSDEDLISAAGLKKGVMLDYADMNDRTKQLLDTGLFSTLAFKFDGQDLIFMLTPSASLYPIHLDNLPLVQGPELAAAIHKLVPLYYGKIPAEGGITEAVRGALEKLLAEKGFQATVAAVPGTVAGEGSAVHFSIASPQVLVGPIEPTEKSAALDKSALEILSKLTGSPYDVAGSPSQITTYLGNFYHDRGYLEAMIEASSQKATTGDGVIRVPFAVAVAPGMQYRMAAVRLAPGLVVTQADFDRQAHIRPGDIADGQHVIENWEYINRQYHNHGYMKASVHPTPAYDRSSGTVSYDVTADAGPVYAMGALSIENVSDDLRTLMMAAWKMPAGVTFNEGAIRSFYATDATVNSTLSRLFANVNCSYTLRLNDEKKTVDVTLRLDRKKQTVQGN
jgi:outer membrane protein assembly factor BamA